MSGETIPPIRPDARMDLGQAFAGVERQLRLVLTLRADPHFRMAVLDGRSAVAVHFEKNSRWGLITTGGFSVGPVGDKPESSVASQAIAKLFIDPHVIDALELYDAKRRNQRAAGRLVKALLIDDQFAFRRLLEWSPVIETASYAIGMHIAALLDEMRGDAENVPATCLPRGADGLQSYRQLVAALGRATLFATDASSPWLADMAHKGPSDTKTPSFRLVRERDLWSSLIGARAASRFGLAIVQRYFDVLGRSHNPPDMLDALAALTAIGLRHPRERDAIRRQLKSALPSTALQSMPDAQLIVLGVDEALGRPSRPTPSPIPERARYVDAFSIDADGSIPFFAFIQDAVERPAWSFFPASQDNSRQSRRASEIFQRSWRFGKEETEMSWAAGHA